MLKLFLKSKPASELKTGDKMPLGHAWDEGGPTDRLITVCPCCNRIDAIVVP